MTIKKIYMSIGGLCLISLLGASPTRAAGFAVFDQGASATGMGGAVTAQSEAIDTLFHNIAGAAFFDETTQAAGVLYRATSNLALETQPEIGDIASAAEQDDPFPVLVHAYTVHPISSKLNFGVAFYSPFDLDTTHANPDSFPGRTTSVSSTIRTLDANFSLSTRLGRRFGFGLGAVVRVSTISLLKRLQIQDPSSQSNVDFASLDFATDPQAGVGWNLGLLHKISDRLSLGLAYRSPIAIDFSGTGALAQIGTGNPQLDDILALSNPFDTDLPLRTALEFPDVASFGVALRPSSKLLFEVDVNRTGWSSVQDIRLRLPGFPSFSDTVELNLEDAFTYRLGAQFTTAKGAQWRAGYAFDQSPQAEGELNAFLIDTDRNVVSLGFGRDWLQVAVQWINLISRSGNSDDLSGTVYGDIWQVSVTLRKKKKLKLPSGSEIKELAETQELIEILELKPKSPAG